MVRVRPETEEKVVKGFEAIEKWIYRSLLARK